MNLACILATGLLMLLSACAPRDPVPQGRGPGSPANVERSDGQLVEMVCEDDGSTRLLTTRVAVQADGLHVRVRNLTGEPVSINGLALDFDEGRSEQVTTFVVPGEVMVACWPFSRHEGPEPDRVPFTITDPNGYWRSAELACGPDGVLASGISDYVAGAEGEHGEPVEIARRRLTGLKPADELLRAGYPESALPIVAVVRDGRTVASVSFRAAEAGGWLVSGQEACDATGIRSGR